MNELMTQETVRFLERATRDPSIDVTKLEALIALQERVAAREAERRYSDAMNALQAEMPQVLKDKPNRVFNSRYATYEAIDRVMRPYYTKHGFSVSFKTEMNGNRIRVTCVVRAFGHTDAENSLESSPDTVGSQGRAVKTEVQGVGSVVSYLKRYTFCAAFAVAVQDDETDDDGEAMRPQRRAPPPPPPPQPPETSTEQRLARLQELLDACPDTDAIENLRTRSRTVIETAPPEIKARIESMFNEAARKIAVNHDPVLNDLVAQVDTMTLDELENLGRNAAWQKKIGTVFPPDMDQLIAHIEMRKQQLRGDDNG